MAERKQKTKPEILRKIKRAGIFLTGLRSRFNEKLNGKYSPETAALLTAALVGLAAVILLFLPPFVGVGDDGSLAEIMKQAGLSYRKSDLEAPSGAYFIRQYLMTEPQQGKPSILFFLIHWAKTIDVFFTKDSVFDIRYLAVLYLIFYLPAVWLASEELMRRVKNASETLALALLCSLILGDGAVLGYFNSLYPEGCWFTLLLYIFGFCLSMQSQNRTKRECAAAGLCIAGILIAFVEAHCAVITFGVVIFLIRQMMVRGTEYPVKVIAAGASFVLALCVFAGGYRALSRFTEESELNAMTTGVLMQASDPSEALSEFGIDSRFEILADASTYEDYPLTLTDHKELKEDFLDQYNVRDIGFYYLRHPLQTFSMLNLGVRSAFQMNRNYVGNYEQKAGLPERAGNVLFIAFSTFMGNAAPRTVGSIVILAVIYCILLGRKKTNAGRQEDGRSRIAALDTFFLMLFVACGHVLWIIFHSGYAEIERYGSVCGFCIWLMTALFLTEILHRIGIFGSEEKKA